MGYRFSPLLPAQVIPHKPACVMENIRDLGHVSSRKHSLDSASLPCFRDILPFCHRKWRLSRDSSKPRGEKTGKTLNLALGVCLPWPCPHPPSPPGAIGAAWGCCGMIPKKPTLQARGKWIHPRGLSQKPAELGTRTDSRRTTPSGPCLLPAHPSILTPSPAFQAPFNLPGRCFQTETCRD